MINSHGKLLFSAFIVIIIGVALIQPIGDDVERVKLSSYSVDNESVILSNVLTSILNETLDLSAGGGENGTLANSNISTVTAIRNGSGDVITTDCNVTYQSGFVKCDIGPVNDSNISYFDYTHVSGKTGNLAETDEIITLEALRNVTSTDLLSECNITLSTGALVCNNTYSFVSYADYQYDTDTYVASGAARTLLTLTVLFFAVAILVVGIGYAVKSFREGGVM